MIIYLTETRPIHSLYGILKRGSVVARKAPGKSQREGITMMELADMFPDETLDTADPTAPVVCGMAGKRLTYRELVA